MPSRKTLSYGVIALAGLIAPFGLEARGGTLRLQSACAQDGQCVLAAGMICFSNGVELINHMCTAGCGS